MVYHKTCLALCEQNWPKILPVISYVSASFSERVFAYTFKHSCVIECICVWVSGCVCVCGRVSGFLS